MKFQKEECQNAVFVLEQAKQALLVNNFVKLKDLSNQTIHSSCFYQDAGSITTGVLIYTLSKLLERQDHKRIKFWNQSVKKIISYFELAISALKNNNIIIYQKHMLQARKTLESISGNLKPYIQQVLKKAAINKAGKLHEHGISIEQTSRLLGISQWEVAEYTGQKQNDIVQTQTISVKQRAKMAMEFFS
jgi:hypothetical protein